MSYAPPDHPWAQWIAVELRAAGHDVRLHPADAGFADRLVHARSGPEPVLLLLSAEHHGAGPDWKALATLTDQVIILGLDDTGPPPELRRMSCRSLHGLGDEDAHDLLMTLVGGPRRGSATMADAMDEPVGRPRRCPQSIAEERPDSAEQGGC